MPATRPTEPSVEDREMVEHVPGTDAPVPGHTPGSYVDAIVTDYAGYVATGLIQWFGATAFTEGQPVPASHPGIPQWVADGSVRQARA